MVFAHQVTALEAYLGDSLINAVKIDPNVVQRPTAKVPELTSEKFTLAEILKDPGLLQRKVLEFLRFTLYHNLEKVDSLYNYAPGFAS
jgi:hypothetical protein